MKNPKVVVCIKTFNRVDCARINMEIIKLNYPHQWPIVHACSNKKYRQYIEAVLVKREPKSMWAGAFDLLQSSMIAANAEYAPDYIVQVEADTWLMNQGYIEKYIALLSKNPSAVIAASSWSSDKSEKWRASGKLVKKLAYYATRLTKCIGLPWHIGWYHTTIASQFFIIKNTAEVRELFSTMEAPEPDEYLEKYLFSKVTKRFGQQSIVWMKEREPVHPKNRNLCEEMELFCQHFPSRYSEGGSLSEDGKREVLLRYPHLKRGRHMKKLLQSEDLSYYNPGASRV